MFKAIEKSEGSASVRRATAVTRLLGYQFRNSDAAKWLAPFVKAADSRSKDGRFQKRGANGEIPGDRSLSTTGIYPGTKRGPAGAVKVSLVSKVSTTPNGVGRGSKMKQAALDLGAQAAPAIDFDRKKLDFPDDLPAEIPHEPGAFRDLARSFCRAFGGCSKSASVEKHLTGFLDALVLFRKNGIAVEATWAAFRDAVITQEGRPLFGAAAKKAFGYLPGRKVVPIGPRVDSCGCKLPEGVFLPKLGPTETAHWCDDFFIFGNTFDPPAAQKL